MQDVGGALQPPGVMDRLDRAEMPEFNMHIASNS